MKLHKSLIAIVLIACLALCACSQEPAPTTTPTNGTIPTTAPTVGETTAPTEPAPDPEELYSAAVSTLSGCPNLTLNYTYDESRVVGGETYTENRTGNAVYMGLGTEDMSALVTEDLTYGGFSTQYSEAFRSGTAYSHVSNCNFSATMDASTFLASQIPALLLNRELYSTLDAQFGETTTLLFSDATALESWAAADPAAQLITAGGSATLDDAGNITSATYHAEYTYFTTVYTLDVTVQIITDTAELVMPDYSENCTALSNLQLPKYLLRAVGDVYTAKNMSVSYYDTLYSQAVGQIRTQSSTYDTYGSGDSFIAGLTNQVSVTDYTGATVSNSQTITYIGGQYSYQYNDGEPTVDSNVDATQVRTSWEDSILSALMMPSHIADAQVTDTGDFLYIAFTGNDSFAKSLCSSIYGLFGVDLDTFATSYSTEYIKGYLSINKYTLLPTSMGMSLSRSHVINGVSYQLTYQLDQSLELSSTSAYKNITGEEPAETGTDTASPLFYKVTGSDGQVMWLLGTIHVGDCRTANLPQQIMDAFAASDAVAIECNNDAFAEALQSDSSLQLQVSGAYYYSNGTTVSSHISADLYEQLLPMMMVSGANNMNGPYLKTIFWQSQLDTLLLQQSYSLSPNKGVESRLLQWAAQQEKKIYEVESVTLQLQMLAGFSEDLQETMLKQTLDAGLAGTYEDVTALYELWCQGDETALTEALASDTSDLSTEEAALVAEYNKAVITDRNKGMLTVATGYLESDETVFYAVGLGHLLGDGGLVQLLRDAGYTVEIVTYE